MPRRRAGALRPIEFQLLALATEWAAGGQSQFHGFAAAKALQERGDTRRLTATGTLYRALSRLEGFGFLSSTWEERHTAAAPGRPLRNLYTLTAAGEAALARAEVDERLSALNPSVQPS